MMYPVDEDDDGDMSESGRSCTKSDTEDNDSQLDIDEDEDNQAAHKMELRKRKEHAKTSYACSACNKSFTARSRCIRHIVEQHSGFSWKCRNCNKTFYRNTPRGSCHKIKDDFIRVHKTKGIQGDEANKEYKKFRQTEACRFVKQVDKRKPRDENVNMERNIHKGNKRKRDRTYFSYNPCFITASSPSSDSTVVFPVEFNQPVQGQSNYEGIRDLSSDLHDFSAVSPSTQSPSLSVSADSTVVTQDELEQPWQIHMCYEDISDSEAVREKDIRVDQVENDNTRNIAIGEEIQDESNVGLLPVMLRNVEENVLRDGTTVVGRHTDKFVDLSSDLHVFSAALPSTQSSSSPVATDSTVGTQDEFEQPVQSLPYYEVINDSEAVREEEIRVDQDENENTQKITIGEEIQDESNVGLLPVKLRNVEENLTRDGTTVVGRHTDKFVLEVAGVELVTSKIVLRNSPTLVELMVANPNEKKLFIDRDSTAYDEILNYLRCMQSRQQYPDSLLPRDSTILTKMMLECDYLQLPELQNLAKTRRDKFMGENQDN